MAVIFPVNFQLPVNRKPSNANPRLKVNQDFISRVKTVAKAWFSKATQAQAQAQAQELYVK